MVSSWLHTRRVGRWIKCPKPDDRFLFLCQKYCLKLQSRHKHPVRFKDQLLQIAPFHTKYFDAAKLIPGTTVLGKAIMDMSGAILLWQRLCNGEPRPDMTIGGDTTKSKAQQNNLLLFKV